LTMQKCYG